MNVEVVVLGPKGTNVSILSKLDMPKPMKVKAKRILPDNPGCVHIEHGPDQNVFNCSNAPALKKANGFLCEHHHARLFPTYGLGIDALKKINYKGSVEDQIIFMDKRQIEKDIQAGIVTRPRYGTFTKSKTEDEVMDELLSDLANDDEFWEEVLD